jgi:integrase
VVLALNTGMRYSEIRLLKWKQIDFSASILIVGKSKSPSGSGRAISLNPRILNVLEMWAAQFPERLATHYVFPREKCGAKGVEGTFGFTADVVTYDTDPTRPIGDWKEAWEKAKKRAGAILSGKADDEDSEPLVCRFHDLRHTAVTRLLEAGIPYPVVASMMGWPAATAIRMSKRYGHIGSRALREAA